MSSRIEVRPAHEVSWGDIQAVFGDRGPAARCQCQRYKLQRREHFAGFPVAERADRLRKQTHGEDPGSHSTSGLVAYLDGQPAGWCAVEPRAAYTGLLRNNRVPWAERNEDRQDPSVWAVTCVLVRAGLRRRGVSRELVLAAVAFARGQGAHALEAYPMTTTDALLEELHVGIDRVFTDAGFVQVTRPTTRRSVVRLDL